MRRTVPLSTLLLLALPFLALPLLAAGCGGRPTPPVPEEAVPASDATAPAPRFVDVTEAAGVRFTHFNDATPERLLPETMGSGLAFFDYDGDGHPDIYFVNGAPLAGSRAAAPSGALYRNRGDGTFEDRTAAAGLTAPFYGMGAAVGDVDNDGHTDLLVTAVGGDRLYRNLGDGTFADVSAAWGLGPADGGSSFSASAAFVDVDRDGFLDLYVTRYVTWSPATDVRCSPDGVHRTYCTPEVYDGAPNRLYRNVGGRRFADVTRQAGLWWPEGKSLGVAVLDADPDDWPDLVVANDTSRNTLYRNLGRSAGQDGAGVRFEEVGVEAGVAYSESGATRGGMGVDVGDVDGDGLEDVVIGNFAQEMSALYRARGPVLFIDDAAQRGIGLPTLLSLTFGTLLFDHDGDGDLDLALANGHIEPDIAVTRPLHDYAQRPQLFENRPGADGTPGHFVDLEPPPGDAFARELVGRGLAAADLDGDGDLDLVVTQNGRPARLFRNDAAPHRWLRVRLVGTASNRTGYGARVRVVAGERSWQRTLTSGSSYLSASEPVLTFGLGDAEQGDLRVDRLEITWPSGRFQVVDDPGIDRVVTVVEG